MMLARRCAAALRSSSLAPPLCVYSQSVRFMGRGPTIQGKKNATDAKRTATNAKLAREIMVISKCEDGVVAGWGIGAVGGDANNVRLAAAVNKAKAANMPKDKIEAAIKRGVEGKDGSNAEAVLYEASGPSGSALMIETLTDNKRRTAPALRHILGKHNGALGTNGSVAWMFERKGYLEIELPVGEIDEDSLMEIALEAGADDVETREGLAQVTCDPSDLAAVRKGFAEAGLEPAISELIYNPKEFLDLEDEQRETFDKLIDALNEDEDVSQIHHNVNE
uniref:Transcriptional regulatory protein n=1 Tax=Phytophthora ramorum TaxID=164328 RepID=H3H4Q6_PHYRM